MLERLGPDYRFATRFTRGGTVNGDLLVDASGDPFFVYENAFLVLRKLNALGLHDVAGDLKVQGPSMLNWQADPAGTRLKRALQGLDGAAAWTAIGEPPSRLVWFRTLPCGSLAAIARPNDRCASIATPRDDRQSPQRVFKQRLSPAFRSHRRAASRRSERAQASASLPAIGSHHNQRCRCR